MFSAGIIIASDKGAKGEREDISGKVIERILIEKDFEVKKYCMLPDERQALASEMVTMSDQLNLMLIVTTGGTGFAQRDVTPEATRDVIEKEAQGISEAMRAYSMTITKRAMLSRGVSGIRGNSLIVNLPGSPKAVEESLTYIIDSLKHGIEILIGSASECGRK